MPTKKLPTKKTAARTAKTAGGVSNNSIHGEDFEQLEEILTRSTPTPAGMRIIALTLAAWVKYYGCYSYIDWCEALKENSAADILDSLTAINTAYHRIADYRMNLNPMHQYLYKAMLDGNDDAATRAAIKLAFDDEDLPAIRDIFREKLTAEDLDAYSSEAQDNYNAMCKCKAEERSA